MKNLLITSSFALTLLFGLNAGAQAAKLVIVKKPHTTRVVVAKHHSHRVWVAGHWNYRPISGSATWVPGHWKRS